MVFPLAILHAHCWQYMWCTSSSYRVCVGRRTAFSEKEHKYFPQIFSHLWAIHRSKTFWTQSSLQGLQNYVLILTMLRSSERALRFCNTWQECHITVNVTRSMLQCTSTKPASLICARHKLLHIMCPLLWLPHSNCHCTSWPTAWWTLDHSLMVLPEDRWFSLESLKCATTTKESAKGCKNVFNMQMNL